MKKLLALLLALTMAFTMLAFVSCGDKDKDSDETKPKTTTKDPDESGDKPDKDGFVTVDKTYYVTAENGLNVRKAPDADAEKLGSLPFGSDVKVTGENAELGWFRIEYNEEIGYVNANYLATEKPENEDPSTADVVADDQFTEVNETVYIFATNYDSVNKVDVHQHDVEKVNAYSRPYAADWDGKSDAWIPNHASVTRVAVYNSNPDDLTYGWSKISYVETEGGTPVILYVRNSQIATELPAECTPSETPAA